MSVGNTFQHITTPGNNEFLEVRNLFISGYSDAKKFYLMFHPEEGKPVLLRP